MAAWLTVAWDAAALNVLLLRLLGPVGCGATGVTAPATRWGCSCSPDSSSDNLLWLYFSLLHPGFPGWFADTDPGVQVGVTLLCGLELLAPVVLARITRR